GTGGGLGDGQLVLHAVPAESRAGDPVRPREQDWRSATGGTAVGEQIRGLVHVVEPLDGQGVAVEPTFRKDAGHRAAVLDLQDLLGHAATSVAMTARSASCQ